MEISIKWSMCRTCESDRGSTLMPIFESNAAKHLNEYAGVAVEEDDGLPDQICTDCVERLEEVHRFLSDCRSSDEHLRNLVRQTMSSASRLQSKDSNINQRKRARKQHIAERVIDEQPLMAKKEKVIGEPKETATKCEIFVPNETSSLEEEAAEKYLSAISVNQENHKPEIIEEYTISDLVEENAIETLSQDSNMDIHLDSSSQKSESATEYNIDLGVACIPDRHRCNFCSNTYPNASLLKSHLRSHGNEKCYECEVCGKRFRAACNLTTHIRTHTGEKPFKCAYCERRFADRSTLRKHERMHTNERPYSCKVCGKAFSLSTSLKAHFLSHSSEKPHKCVTCDKGFRLRHQLKAHEKTHVHRHEMDITIADEDYDLLLSS